MGEVVRLYHTEALRFREARLRYLAGDPGGDRAFARTMEEIAVRLARIESAYAAGAFDRMGKGARALAVTAEDTGLVSVRDAANAVADLSESRDNTALAACVARLLRVGQASLAMVWDTEHIMI
jgi:hypothetical protein